MTATRTAPAPGTPHRHRPGMPWTAARAAAAAAAPVSPARLPLARAEGCALAADAPALVPMPTVDTSAMDGFAVHGPGPWWLTGRIDAGHGPAAPLSLGNAVQISTGAPIPEGATAVLPVEQATLTGDLVHGDAEPGRHIRSRGEDAQAGTVLLPAGTRLSPPALGLLAAAGYDELTVRPRPRCTLLLTGDELLTHGLPHAGWVRDAVGPMLPGLLHRLGCEVTGTEHIPDTPARALLDAFTRAEADVLVVCGATSAGPTDRLRPLLARFGARIVVDGVACRPGHPMLLAHLPDGCWVVGLPGNPYAALVAVHTLFAPLADALQARPSRPLPRMPMDGAPVPPPGETRIVPALWCGDRLEPLPEVRPASLSGAARGDVLAVVDATRLGSATAEVLALL